MEASFQPFIDPDVQHALQHLVRLVSDVALRSGNSPLSMTLAAAALEPDGSHTQIDVMVCGECNPGLISNMTSRILAVALNDDGQAETLTLKPSQ
ncbi:MAG: hypothetical protein ACRCYS_15775 [Beijerinckiaceae bacterium]